MNKFINNQRKINVTATLRLVNYEKMLEEKAPMVMFNMMDPASPRLLQKVSEFRVSPMKNQLKVRIVDRTNNSMKENFFDRVDNIYRRTAPTR